MLNNSIYLVDGTPTGTTSPGRGYDEVVYIP